MSSSHQPSNKAPAPPGQPPISTFERVKHTSPLRDDSRMISEIWNMAAQEEPVYKGNPHGQPTLVWLKLHRLQRYYWPALVKAVEKRAEWKDGKMVAGGWNVNDFNGMIDWYRGFFKLGGWWMPTESDPNDSGKTIQNTINRLRADDSHNDGMWLTVLMTSPWAYCPLLDKFKAEMIKDSQHNLLVDHSLSSYGFMTSLPSYKNRDHRSDVRQQEFLEAWVKAANEWTVQRLPNGNVVTPWSCGDFKMPMLPKKSQK